MQQQVSFFESSQVPVDLIVLIDTSSSMADKMEVGPRGGDRFLRTLRAGTAARSSASATRCRSSQPLTADRALLEQAVHSTVARGGTALNNALYVALKQFGGRASRATAGPPPGDRACSPTAKTPPASSASTMCWSWRGRRASTSTPSACSRRAERRRSAPVAVPLAGAVLDEDAGAGDRRARRSSRRRSAS